MFTTKENSDHSGILITALSFMFTLISIFLSILENVMQKKFGAGDSFVIVQFPLISQHLAQMGYKDFEKKIVFRKNMEAHVVAKMLYVCRSQVERLFPIQNAEGAALTYFIGVDGENVGVVKCRLKEKIDDGTLVKVCYTLSIFAVNRMRQTQSIDV